MIRIAISQAAFEAIAATLPLGSVSYENATDERGGARPRSALMMSRSLLRQGGQIWT